MEKAVEIINYANDFYWSNPVADEIRIENPDGDDSSRYSIDCTRIPETKIIVAESWYVIGWEGICPNTIDICMLLASPSGEVLSKWIPAFPHVHWWYVECGYYYTNFHLLPLVNTDIEGIIFFVDRGHFMPELGDLLPGWNRSVFYGKYRTYGPLMDGTYVIFTRIPVSN